MSNRPYRKLRDLCKASKKRHRHLACGMEQLESRQLLTLVPGDDIPAIIARSTPMEYFPHLRGDGTTIQKANAKASTASLASASLVQSPPFALGDTFRLHSNPSATIKIYLDFDGYVTQNKIWNFDPLYAVNRATIITPPFDFEGSYSNFTETELTTIQKVWQRVTEDFIPFNIDVTTEDPGDEALFRSSLSDFNYGMRVTIGGTSGGVLGPFYDSLIGIGLFGIAPSLGDFDVPNDGFESPTFVFTEEMALSTAADLDKAIADTVSHEVGHTLGLYHYGNFGLNPFLGPNIYYPGHGTGETGWGPIIGGPDSKNLTTWTNGDYYDSFSTGPYFPTQDDLAIITGNEGVQYRVDDYGSDLASATAVSPNPDGSFAIAGIIERNTDTDWFRVNLTSGPYSFSARPMATGPNLDTQLALFDSSGRLINISDPQESINSGISGDISAGTYYLRIDGVGKFFKSYIDAGYSDYGSLGQYTITGNSNSSSGSAIVTGYVLLDANGNSARDASEAGLPNARVYIDVNRNNLFDGGDVSTFTDSSGNYSLNTGGLSQNLIVRAIIPNEFRFSNPVGGFQILSIGASGVATANFFLRGTGGTVYGAKFLDLNGNGLLEPALGDKGLPGVTIYVDTDRDGNIGVGEPAAVTDANGNFVITNAPIGTYQVREVFAPGYQSSSPGPAGNTVTINSGSVILGVHFFNTPVVDYGDAPDSFRTTRARGGASHGFLYNFGLGALTDGEPNGRPSVNAFGDDRSDPGFGVDDEDGVHFLNTGGLASPGKVFPFDVDVRVPSGYRNGFLHAWFDWNDNGTFETSEKMIRGQQVGAGTFRFNIFVPSSVKPGQIYARFRYATAQQLGPAGATLAGEVEDYKIDVVLDRVVGRPDTFTVNQAAEDVPLDVLANDVRSLNGIARIIPNGFPKATDNGGLVSYNDNGTPGFQDDFLVYTAPPLLPPPSVNFRSDHFTYQIADAPVGAPGRTASGPIDVNITLVPIALPPAPGDDSVFIAKDGGQIRIDVLDNDRPGTNSNGVLFSSIDILGFETRRVVQNGVVVSQGVQTEEGEVRLNSNGTPQDPSDDYFVFIPNPNVQGTPTVQFRYFVANPGVRDLRNAVAGVVTIHIGPNTADAGDIGQISFQVFNINADGSRGSRVDNAGTGQVYNLIRGRQYYVGVFALDRRAAFNFPTSGRPANGVTNVYLDVTYESQFIKAARDLKNVTGLDVEFDPRFTDLGRDQSGRLVTEGFIDDIGAVTEINSFGANATKDNNVFLLRFTADQLTPGTAGVRLFQSDPADDVNHEIFVNSNVAPFRPRELTLNQVAYLQSNRFRVVAPAAKAANVAALAAAPTTPGVSGKSNPPAEASVLPAVNNNAAVLAASQLSAAGPSASAIDNAIDDLFGVKKK